MYSNGSQHPLLESFGKTVYQELMGEAKQKVLLTDLKIRTKDRLLIPFVPNKIQSLYMNQLGQIGGKREMILKARQFGFSTLILALLFQDTVNTPNTQTCIIAQDQGSTEKIFQIVQRFQNNLPTGKKRSTKYETRTELYWPDIDSYFFVGTAGSKRIGRGGTINNVHGSEAAFWDDAESIIAGLLQAVPVGGNVWLETTANGMGNYFYQEYIAAMEKRSIFTDRFFPWYLHEEYAADNLITGGQFLITDEEAELQKRYNLSIKQLIWRRNKMVELKLLFPQEYPATPEEAFLTSGATFFSIASLSWVGTTVEPPIAVPVPGQYTYLKRNRQYLQVWKTPQPGKRYVIGADTAEGLTDGGDHDFCSADVFDAETWEQVAQLHGRWEPQEYAHLLNDLGRWYNISLLGVERNNHGHSVLNSLINECDYPPMNLADLTGLYYHEEYDNKQGLAGRKPGWPSTGKNKIFMLNSMANGLEEETVRIKSTDTLRELRTYIKLPGHKYGAEGKAHDDRVVSSSLAVTLLNVRPRVRNTTKKVTSRRGGYI